jgi:predicted transcriptional regulator
MTDTTQTAKTHDGGFGRDVGPVRRGRGETDALVVKALRERGGASFTQLVEEAVVTRGEASASRKRLMRRGLIEKAGVRREASVRHDCPHCRCDYGGRPRAIYVVVDNSEL